MIPSLQNVLTREHFTLFPPSPFLPSPSLPSPSLPFLTLPSPPLTRNLPRLDYYQQSRAPLTIQSTYVQPRLSPCTLRVSIVRLRYCYNIDYSICTTGVDTGQFCKLMCRLYSSMFCICCCFCCREFLEYLTLKHTNKIKWKSIAFCVYVIVNSIAMDVMWAIEAEHNPRHQPQSTFQHIH